MGARLHIGFDPCNPPGIGKRLQDIISRWVWLPPIRAEKNSKPLLLATQIASIVEGGEGYFLALKRDGTLWQWEYSDPGSLIFTQATLERYKDLKKVSRIDEHGYAITEDGVLWGSLPVKQFGTILDTNKTPVALLHDVAHVRMDSHGRSVYAIRKDNTLWCWATDASLADHGPHGPLREELMLRPHLVEQGVLDVAVSHNSSFVLLKTNGDLERLWFPPKSTYAERGDDFSTARRELLTRGVRRLFSFDGTGVFFDRPDGTLYGIVPESLASKRYFCSQARRRIQGEGMRDRVELTLLENVQDFSANGSGFLAVTTSGELFSCSVRAARDFAQEALPGSDLVRVILPPTPPYPSGYFE